MKKIKKSFSIIFSIILLFCIPLNVYAVESGTSASTAINVVYGQEYSKGWNKDNDHLYCYNRISVKQNGVITMKFSKPTDSDGQVGKLNLVLYDDNYDTVWDSKCNYSVETPNPYYVFNVGLKVGDYYLLVKPSFTVTSGTIYTNYSFSFSDVKAEIEPNNSKLTATRIETNGEFYKGFYGKDGGKADTDDYYKFSTEIGRKYIISFKNIDKFIPTYMILRLESADGTGKSIDDEFNNTDDNGNPCYEFFAESTSYTLALTNYSKGQITYSVAVSSTNTTTKDLDYNINEPNDSKDTATYCPIGTKIEGEIGSYEKYKKDGLDTDWYKFSLSTGSKYKISFEDYNINFASTTLMIRLFDPNGNETIVHNKMENSGNDYVEIIPTSSGIYYLKVYNYFDTKSNASHIYSITIDEIPSCECEQLGYKYKISNVNTIEGNCNSKSKTTTTYKCELCSNTYSTVTYGNYDYDNHNYRSEEINATCTEKGYTKYICSRCSDTYNDEYIEAIGHISNSGVVTTKATCGKAGVKTYSCTACGVKIKTETIKATGKHTYDSGKVTKKPTSSATGVMTYTCKTCGAKKTSTIAKLAKASISSLTALSKGFTAKWKKVASATGYQIQYSTSSKFTSPKTVTVTSNSTVSKKITKLTANKKYYVRIRTYKTINGTKYYSAWSASKYVTTKK